MNKLRGRGTGSCMSSLFGSSWMVLSALASFEQSSRFPSLNIIEAWLVFFGIPRSWISITLPKILGSHIPYNHQPTGVLNTAHLEICLELQARYWEPNNVWKLLTSTNHLFKYQTSDQIGLPENMELIGWSSFLLLKLPFWVWPMLETEPKCKWSNNN